MRLLLAALQVRERKVCFIPITAIGRLAGHRELVGEVLSDNAPMPKAFERRGFAMTTKREGVVAHVSLSTAGPTKPDGEFDRPLTSGT